MNKESLIKKEIKWNHLKIQLLEISDPTKAPYQGISNLKAVDKVNNVVWYADTPKAHYDSYHDIELDSEKNILIANSGIGYRYILNPENGKILDNYLIK